MWDGSRSGPAGWLWLPFASSQGIGNGSGGPSGSTWAMIDLLATPRAEAFQLGTSKAPPAALVPRNRRRDRRLVIFLMGLVLLPGASRWRGIGGARDCITNLIGRYCCCLLFALRFGFRFHLLQIAIQLL